MAEFALGIEGLEHCCGPFEVVPIEFYTTLSDEQFAILTESLFEQAVV